ncbi:virulence RhuM family protein [bacterium]|nr:virulence RhuM family protein [bacterium]
MEFEMENEIVIYQPNNTIHLEVRMADESVWLNRNQMSVLFGRDVKTIGKHINNALREELRDMATVANFATVQKEGGRQVTRFVEFYNLDMILSVGYRVKSSQGILFRQWANSVLKEFLLKGYSVNQRFERLEQRVSRTEERIEFFVRTALPPVEGVFFEGQIYDAYELASKLVKSAVRKIILIDNYIDESVLTLLDKRGSGVTAEIYTHSPNAQLQLDIQRHDSQYTPIPIHVFTHSHDRFLCIDDTVYHIGASLKDLGKKWFAFSRMEIDTESLLEKM